MNKDKWGKMLKAQIFLILTILACGACSTIPHDAPDELQEAHTMIRLNEKNGVDKYLPKSNIRSKEMLKNSIKMWNQAKFDGGLQAEMEGVSAVNEANKALETAVKMNEIREKLETIDRDESNLSIGLDKLEGDAEPVVILEKQDLQLQQLVSTLAFFKFDDFQSPIIEKQEFDSIVGVLKDNPLATVTLTGYADNVGNRAYNKKLAYQRSQKVKDLIVKSGVEPDRVLTANAGSKTEQTVNQGGKAHFDRKVQAKIAM